MLWAIQRCSIIFVMDKMLSLLIHLYIHIYELKIETVFRFACICIKHSCDYVKLFIYFFLFIFFFINKYFLTLQYGLVL